MIRIEMDKGKVIAVKAEKVIKCKIRDGDWVCYEYTDGEVRKLSEEETERVKKEFEKMDKEFRRMEREFERMKRDFERMSEDFKRMSEEFERLFRE